MHCLYPQGTGIGPPRVTIVVASLEIKNMGAAMKNISGTLRTIILKTELFYPKNWQDVSVDQFIGAADAYIRWYKKKRIKIS